MTEDHRIVDGRYRLGGRLGRGGMADVHFALDTRLCRPVAVKMLRRKLAGDPAARELFEREAWSVASLSHPAIVAIYDTGEDVDPATGLRLPYLVMEFVPGGTLQAVLAGEQKLSPRRALRLMRGVVAALAYSHETGIIHQDIKPSNVMVTASGEVKVMDFGISRRLADAATGGGPAAAVLGTANYLPPERARGEGADARSDLYSAGCLLYELLVGTSPFDGESPLGIAARHLHDAPVPPSELADGIGPEIDAVVLKALAKDPADRFQSAEEMGEALDNVLAGRRAFAMPTSLADLQTRLPAAAVSRPAAAAGSRRRLALVAGVVAVLFPVAGMAGYDVIRPGAAEVQVAAAPLALEATTAGVADGAPVPARAPQRRTAPTTATPPEKATVAAGDAGELGAARSSTARTTGTGTAATAARPAAKAAVQRESASAGHGSTTAAAKRSRAKASTAAAPSASRAAAASAPRATAPKGAKVLRPTTTVRTPKPVKTVTRPAPAPRPTTPAKPPVAPQAPAPTPKQDKKGHHSGERGQGHQTPKPKASPKKDREAKHDKGKGRSGGNDDKRGSDRRGKGDDHDRQRSGD
jgi:hypothetical protein